MTVVERGQAVAWETARGLAWGAARALPARPRVLAHCIGRILAAPLIALTDLPRFDTAAMDGWAVAGPGPWSVSGRVLAGDAAGVLADGDATEIATGAPLPRGATAVLRWEHAITRGRQLFGDVAMGRDIRHRGQECRRGDLLVPAGTRVTPAVLGLAAAGGYDELVVVDRPSVDLLVLGDELQTAGLPEGGGVRDALGPMLPPWLRALGADAGRTRRVPDDADTLRTALERSTADVVVTTGSTSHGPVDHLRRVLAAAGAETVVDSVAVRPGHPMLLARLDGARRYVVGLPGNPLAAVSGLLTLLTPLLGRLGGAPPHQRRWLRLAEAVRPLPDTTRLVPVARGRPVPFAGSSMLRGLATADAVAVIPPGERPVMDAEILPLDLPG